ncbi:MAG: peptidylprolyl isomerase [Candidatus Sulfotelmatobacter sp.]
MKSQITAAAVLLLTVASASAQVASHAPTALAPQAASASSSFQVTGRAVVRVNGTELTDRDLLREMLAMFPYARMHNGFPKQQEAEIRSGAMQMIVFEELVYQEALRRKMTIAPERILREEKRFRGQFENSAAFNAFLKAEMDGSEARLRRQIKRSLLIQALLKSEVDNKSDVSIVEARHYYDQNPKQFAHDELFAIQTISLLPPNNANPETLKELGKKAESIYQQAKATHNYQEFGLLAEKVSEDDYRVDMGDHKTVKLQSLPPEVVKAARAMKVGEVSPLLQLGTAYSMFRLNAHTPAGKKKFAEVQKELINRLQTQKTEKLRIAFDKKLHQNAKIQEL